MNTATTLVDDTNVFATHVPLACQVCKQDVLQDINTVEATIFCGQDEGEKLDAVHVYCCACIRAYHERGADLPGHEGPYIVVANLLHSPYYLQTWCVLANCMMRQDVARTAFETMRDILVIMAPYVMNAPNDDNSRYEVLRDERYLGGRVRRD